jgi:RimJ/RimL family protein N-acetyltransferase
MAPVNAISAEPISTSRLELVPLGVEHADAMAAVLADPLLYRFIGGSPPTVEELRARYKRQLAGSGEPDVSWCNWVIQVRETADLVGTVQATISASDDAPVAEIAWVVGTAWQGQGIATEAARALVAWLGQQSVRTVIAHVHPGHEASAAVAAAAGFAPTDEAHDGETRWRLTTGL